MPYQVNPMELIQQIKNGKNPQQLLMSILEGNMKSTPLGRNLYVLAQEGRTSEIEKIARNLAKERGIDFDAEFKAFKQKLGLE